MGGGSDVGGSESWRGLGSTESLAEDMCMWDQDGGLMPTLVCSSAPADDERKIIKTRTFLPVPCLLFRRSGPLN